MSKNSIPADDGLVVDALTTVNTRIGERVKRPSSAEKVIYVSPRGSDAADGLTMASSKLTLASAIGALGSSGGTVRCGVGTIASGTALPIGVPDHVRIVGAGKTATTLLHDFNGDFVSMGQGAEIARLTIDGQGATYTGRGLVFDGVASDQRVTDAKIFLFDGECFDFATAAGSGFIGQRVEAYWIAAGTGTGRYAIRVAPEQQLAAKPRTFHGLTTAGQCAIDFGGSNNFFLTSSFVADLKYGPESRGVSLTDVRIANQMAMTFDGHNNSIVACDVLPVVTIAPGADNNVIGPNSLNNGPIIDNSGNDRNNIHHFSYAYTPVLTSGGTAPVLGDGTMVGRWSRAGTQITATIQFTMGSTTTMGTGELRFSLPKERTTGTIAVCGQAILSRGTTLYTAVAQSTGANGYVRLVRDTGIVSSTSPATWAAGDTIRIGLTYLV